MALLYVDHDVSVLVAPLLRAKGHDIVVTSELGLGGESDSNHLLRAAQEGRILVSHNQRDYMLLNRAWLDWTEGWPVYADSKRLTRLARPVARLLLRGVEHGGIVLPYQGAPERIAANIDEIVGPSRGRYRPYLGVLWRQRRSLLWDYVGLTGRD